MNIAYDAGVMVGGVLVLLVALAALVLVIAAIVSIVQSPRYPTGIKALWVLAVLAFPLIGSLAWFIFGRNSHA